MFSGSPRKESSWRNALGNGHFIHSFKEIETRGSQQYYLDKEGKENR